VTSSLTEHILWWKISVNMEMLVSENVNERIQGPSCLKVYQETLNNKASLLGVTLHWLLETQAAQKNVVD
jgi:hypothetical protein